MSLETFKVEIIPRFGVYSIFCFKNCDRTPVGHVVFDPISCNKSIGFVRYINIVREFRGQWIGKFLIDKVKEEFDCLLVERIPNDEMEVFYKKQGFRRANSIQRMWAKPGSSYEKEYNSLEFTEKEQHGKIVK